MTAEDTLQIAASNFLRLQYPKALFFHTPNGGSRNKIEGAKLKRMGILKGVADCLILEARNGFIGLAIELKIKPNQPTPEQLEFLSQLNARKWKTEVIYNLDIFIETVDKYLK